MTGKRHVRVGLKLWSINVDLAPSAEVLHRQGVIDLIELYVVPGTFEKTADTWRSLRVPYMLHCPHAAHGFNLAKPELRETNAATFQEVERFADRLSADVILQHHRAAGVR